MSGHGIVADFAHFVAEEEQKHGALQTHPVFLPGAFRRQVDFTLLVNQPILDDEPAEIRTKTGAIRGR